MAKLSSKGYIKEANYQLFCCNPLTVTGSKKLRLVLNLRHINNSVRYTAFKYDDWTSLENVIGADDYIFTFDYKASYHHFSIRDDHQKYLGLRFDKPDIYKRFYISCVFG